MKWLLCLNRNVFLLVLIFTFSNFLLLSAQKESVDTLGYNIVPLKAGDKCIVCGISLDVQNGIAILYKGRRVPLDKHELKNFLDNADKYFFKLRPSGALFSENYTFLRILSAEWFGVGIWIFLALFSAAICSTIALKKGFHFRNWFFYGLIGNMIAVMIILIYPSKKEVNRPSHITKLRVTMEPVECSTCGKLNHPTAKECTNCRTALNPELDSEVTRTIKESKNL